MTSDPAEIVSSILNQPLRPFEASVRSKGVELFLSVVRTRERGIEFSFSLKGAGSGSGAAGAARFKIADIKPASKRLRRDELWKTTCLELFIGARGSDAYLEMNLSPSGDWNLYAFDSYRAGMRPAEGSEVALEAFVPSTSEDTMTWTGRVRSTGRAGVGVGAAGAGGSASAAGDVSRLLISGPLVVGATAVLEYSDGAKEYWAIAHAGEKPDFHLRDSFRLEI